MHRRRWMTGIVALALAAASFATVAPGAPVAAASPPVVHIGDTNVWEGDSGPARVMSFPVTLSDPVTEPVTVSYHLMGGTATPGVDFHDRGGGTRTVTFKPGRSQTRFINVKVYPDTSVEGNETVMVMVTDLTGPAVLANSMAAGTILDDDPGSGPRLAVSDVTILEGDSGKPHVAKFWVTLSQPAPTFSVNVKTMAMSATAGVDFQPRERNLVFREGKIRRPFTVKIHPDTEPEPDEVFHVMISADCCAQIIDGTGSATIVNDDGGEPPTTTTESFLVGPFNLAAMGQPGWENESSGNVPRPAGSFGIKGMRFDVVDHNGDPIDMHEVHLHHIVLLDHARPDAVCPPVPSRFSGSGHERTPLVLPDQYAYRVGAGDPSWSAAWHVMNMSPTPRTAYIKYEIDHVAHNSPEAARGVTAYWHDVTGPCTTSEYDVPGGGGPGSVHTKSWTYTAPKDGIRVYTGGHLHNGGIDLTMRRTATNEVVCTNTAMYPMPGMLHEITACDDHTPVSAGEQFTTTARYDNSAPVAGAMGIQLSYVWEP
jgi:hypothetical protein